MTQVNHINKRQDKEESQFRVHFYLKNVFYSCEKRLPNFLQETASTISQVVPVSIIQVFGAITKLVDLSVGIKTQEAAAEFLESKKKIYLMGENRLLTEHQPIFSQSFQIFYNRSKKKSKPHSPAKQASKGDKKADLKRDIITPSKVELRSPQKQPSSSKRVDSDFYHSILYILGIPLDFKDKDIVYLLSQHKIRARYTQWKMREDMQYLFVELQQPISEANLYSQEIYIDKYPILVGVKRTDQTISDVILNNEIQINFEKEINEIELMKIASKVGGVILMVKDEYYGPRKYIVCFNKPQKIPFFRDQLQKVFKNVKLTKPKYAVRVSRLQKNFTFSTMLQNLTYHEVQLKKMQISSSLMSSHDLS